MVTFPLFLLPGAGSASVAEMGSLAMWVASMEVRYLLPCGDFSRVEAWRVPRE